MDFVVFRMSMGSDHSMGSSPGIISWRLNGTNSEIVRGMIDLVAVISKKRLSVDLIL
jgi:hypothetical protein